jgi:hypothetical protein
MSSRVTEDSPRRRIALLSLAIVSQISTIVPHVSVIPSHIATIMTDIAFVPSDITLVVPNIFCFLAGCRLVSVAQILAQFAPILGYIALIVTDIAAIMPNVIAIVTNVPAIMPDVADIMSRISVVHYRRGNLCHPQSAHSQRSRRDPEQHLPGLFQKLSHLLISGLSGVANMNTTSRVEVAPHYRGTPLPKVRSKW